MFSFRITAEVFTYLLHEDRVSTRPNKEACGASLELAHGLAVWVTVRKDLLNIGEAIDGLYSAEGASSMFFDIWVLELIVQKGDGIL